MIVADTSVLVSTASVDLLDTFLSEFDVHTTETVVEEPEETGAYDDRHGDAADAALDSLERVETHRVEGELTSSRVDRGEGSCTLLTEEREAEFLITDDLRALPELQNVANAKVAVSPIVPRALVERGVLERDEAVERLDDLAERRDWLGAPIHRRARRLFEN
jgi:predicted nucleic acid-binding protein